ncbi:MAG TPA: SNF2-related protein [Armatimonadota bacterium]|nr:SNF2-related protein [Armatimonadota bacterium]HPO73773.1 SNF2-related protein [Armatimonadota bacterium]
MSTPYHAAYYAYELTRRSASDDYAKLGPSLFNATVDLNPHQIDAALFAFRSPLSRGAILADEVGLGKSIEAGLIVSQLWAERKRRILVVVPAILRKQWQQELLEKFYIQSHVIDSREYNAGLRAGEDPFTPTDCVVICSYHFARSKEDEVRSVPWDLVIIDEAHRLRNVYKPSNKIANAIKGAILGRPLLLLTATPLQNSLLELYGLVSFLDEHFFGDMDAFRARYMRGPVQDREIGELRHRMRAICQRTLRRQVVEYVRFTKRIPITQDFTPTPEEQELYERVSGYLQREKLNALPASQRKLMTLILRKLLASSTFAIAGTLAALAERLQQRQGATVATLDDFEVVDEVVEEWSDSEEEQGPAATCQQPGELGDIAAEIAELTSYRDLASSITLNAKGQALLQALEHGFAKLDELGANRKAVIFTESRRTQEYLFDLLNRNGYEGRVLTVNGTNTDDRSGAIYREWLKRHQGEPVVTGSKAVDLRAALVEQFRDHADILVATEAAAEGVNLQFCSLVVNYDLPWNPQRIEQRVGRCHRYGQAHDVVVVNFLNRENAADQRVFELLSEKFRLFDGVFGSSDEVLGALESGVDFERRIAGIYQSCRTTEEIDAAFNSLQQQLEEEIAARMADTRAKLLEHFDEEVHERLRMSREASRSYLARAERWLWSLTQHELGDVAAFDEERLEFDLHCVPHGWPDAPLGRYQFVTRTTQFDGHHAYRLGHPLAQAAIEHAKERSLPCAQVTFSYTAYAGRVGLVEPLVGRSGYLTLTRLTVSALEDEDHLLFAACDDAGNLLHPEVCERLFHVPGLVSGEAQVPPPVDNTLQQRLHALQEETLARIGQRNARFFDDEVEKLDRWADDLKHGLETELKDLDFQIKQARKEARLADSLERKLALHRTIKDLETERTRKRRSLYEAQDDIDARKEALISKVEARLHRTTRTENIFTIRWHVG